MVFDGGSDLTMMRFTDDDGKNDIIGGGIESCSWITNLVLEITTAKQIVDSSFRLFQGSVSLYEGSYEKGKKPSIPQFSGAVLEACFKLRLEPPPVANGNNQMDKVLQNDIDLLNPPAELEKRKHKLKRLVQSPNSFFMLMNLPHETMRM
ncbi:hypothetical protein ISN45_Aa04g005120 [Arabidopsis thaliana x Arabidopsis arenosa]|uniref:Uncharacterized protein n=1 Tax=Arabidopsis thaliana x Arabidopsis arenosa TaxID=1240361 RepID=A0A8T2A392_9BRAS|nr:hypothetical protein ISN45_Aa04g005120 [Arabidopsis thaliana x Arabidopsis arenosa]